MLKLERKEQMELLEKVLNAQNLVEATNAVLANKGAGGVDKLSVEQFKEKYERGEINFEEIKELIRNRKYNPQPVKRVYIPKENGDKRGLGIPTIMDRIIQQAIAQVLTPIYEEQFSETSYGFRPGRSCEMAIIKALEIFNDGYNWIVDIDLEKFFDNVSHDKLISIIMKTIHDGELVSLIRKYLKAGIMENGVVIETTKGTPQGGNISPLLSNIMLNELDKELDKRKLYYVRYADDCLIMVKSEKAAYRVMETITKFIEKKLGLKVNATKSKVARPTDIKYLGFGFYQNKTGTFRPKPHLKSIQKFKRKLKQITRRNRGVAVVQLVKELNAVIRGWINYFRIADMQKAMRVITSHLNRRLRCYIWKQWKTCNHRISCLKKLGVYENNAKRCAYSRKSYWFMSNQISIKYAISNKRLKQKGLLFPIDHYLKVHKI